MKYEFNGISTEQFNEQDRELFTTSYDEETLIENKPFTVELDNKEVKLHLYIEHIDMSEFEDSTDHIISIGVVPAFESLSDKNQQDILSQFAEDEQDMVKEDTMGLVREGLCYGFGIPLRSVTVQEDEVEHTIDSAIAVRHAVSGLIGFELDRHINAIGNTGWDFLSDYCEDQDLLGLAIARFNK